MNRFRLARCLGLALLAVVLITPRPSVAAPQSIAVQRLQQAIEVDPGNLPLHYYLGVNLLLEGDNQGAVEQFRTAYPAFTDSLEMNYNFALAQTRLGDVDSALLYLERAEDLGAAGEQELYPIANIYYNLALLRLGEDQTEPAIKLFRKALQLNPENIDIHRLLGETYVRRGETRLALQHWQEYLQRFPNDDQAREQIFTIDFNDGLKDLEAGHPEAARKAFNQGLKLMPESPLAHYYLGYLAYQSGQQQEALSELGKALPQAPAELQESLQAMIFNSASDLLEAGQPEAAQPAIELLAQGAADDIRSLYLTGRIHLALKQYLPARKAFLQVLKQQPKHKGATLNLIAAEQGAAGEAFQQGRTLYRQGAFAKAIKQLQAAVAINPAYPLAQAYLDQAKNDLASQRDATLQQAEQALKTGHPQKALQLARQILENEPRQPRAQELETRALTALTGQLEELRGQATAREATGDLLAAEALYQQLIALDPGSQAGQEGLERLADERRNHADELVKTGEQALEHGELQKAQNAFQQARKLAPGLASASQGLERAEALLVSMVDEELQAGRQAAQAGQLAEAREHLDKAWRLRHDPAIKEEIARLDNTRQGKVGKLLAAARQDLGKNQLRQAGQLLNRAQRLSPDNVDVRALQADLDTRIEMQLDATLAKAGEQLAAGHFPQALAGFRKALELRPGQADALAGLEKGKAGLDNQLNNLVARAEARITAGDYAAGEDLVKQALTLDPYQDRARQLKHRLGQLQQAGLQPSDAKKLYLEGIELYTQGRYEDAVNSWKKVLILKPGHEKAKLNIEKARRKLKQIEEYRHG